MLMTISDVLGIQSSFSSLLGIRCFSKSYSFPHDGLGLNFVWGHYEHLHYSDSIWNCCFGCLNVGLSSFNWYYCHAFLSLFLVVRLDQSAVFHLEIPRLRRHYPSNGFGDDFVVHLMPYCASCLYRRQARSLLFCWFLDSFCPHCVASYYRALICFLLSRYFSSLVAHSYSNLNL